MSDPKAPVPAKYRIAYVAVFIDGAYLEELYLHDAIKVKVDFARFSFEVFKEIEKRSGQSLQLLRTYYYHALPYLDPKNPRPGAEAAYYKKANFFQMLQSLPVFEVRKGRTVRRFDDDGVPYHVQKQVDVLLGLDFALLAAENRITHAVLVAGDEDFVPALEAAKARGVQVWVVHGPRDTVGQQLLSTADWAFELDEKLQKKVSMP